jgi:GntR family transcriptional regulator/MocR family aminotransferase
VDVHVSLSRVGQLAADVYQQLKEAILDGRLAAGERVPASRELARRLAVSRNTVLDAYQRLTAEGFLVGRVGSGTIVAAPLELRPRRALDRSALAPRPLWRALARAVDVGSAPRATVAYDFQIGAPDPALFPWDEWRRRVARELHGRRRVGGYPDAAGDPRLRAAIARHIGLSRSVRAGADDVLVTSGAQQAFDLVGRVLLAPGQVVAVENPGYPPARQAFLALGAEVAGVRVDAQGIEVDALPERARLVYTTPSHQFPLGTAMSLARRLALLDWADRHGAAILEDDYDSEFRFDGRPLEPLQSLDRHGRVLYVGTFSKVLLPTLRLGFVVAPPSLMPSLLAARRLADSHGPLELARALAAFIDDGLFARHVRRLLRVYRERRQRLLAAVERELGAAVVALPSSAGLHTSVWFRDRALDVAQVAARALAVGVRVEPLRPYFCDGARPRPRAGLALGYGLIAADRIDEGIRRLARCLP